ncbi:MAG: nucleotide exchange factor GrpE [Deltaproteobacteria bacterium]|nr:nucleotide exchange factor GrpE [Deltaproteobacteria bacterium]
MKTNSKDKQKESEELTFKTDDQPVEEADSVEEDLLSKEESLEKELQEGKKAFEELNDQYLRLAADFDNYKKRISREKADLISYGNEELIKSLLSVLDNLERGIEHSETNTDTSPIIEGLKLVHKQFVDCLEKYGVKAINVHKGDQFDPKVHQAVERVESDEIQPGFILSELLKGYMLKDRLLRPALVSVSKGDAETASDIESDENEIEVNITNGDDDGKPKLIDGDV